MAFFEIQNPDYDSDKIELEIIASLKKREIPIEQEREFVDKYNLETARREILASPMHKLKVMIFPPPRWIIQLFKRMPFYETIRKLLHPNL
tara:strand:- start:7592 stop:7864 length:273 start_codon:yes stop_codon:yes gene_type:complete